MSVSGMPTLTMPILGEYEQGPQRYTFASEDYFVVSSFTEMQTPIMAWFAIETLIFRNVS